jgi:hypothetical protein
LEVDPTGDDHRGCEDEFEGGIRGVALVVVVVKKDAAAEVEVAGALAGCGDESGVAGESPFGADLGPVGGALEDAAVEVAAKVGADPEGAGALAAGFFGGAVEPELEGAQVLMMGFGQGLQVEEGHFVGGGVVKASKEEGVIGNVDAQLAEAFAHVGKIEEGGGDTRV